MMIPYILFFIGFILLIKGGDLLVEGAVRLAKITGLPELLIGATIVSLATTLPEAMVSVLSAIHHETSMSIGNALGSIIFNTGFILGLSNLIKPGRVHSRFFYMKSMMLLLYIAILWILAENGVIGGRSSILLLSMLLVYILFNVGTMHYKNHSSKGAEGTKKKNKTKRSSFPLREALLQILQFIFGALVILVGADLLVHYGVIIAGYWKIPSGVLSLTLIAFGTSLPELITTITALRKGHSSLSLGTILGANILNVSMVLGLSAGFNPLMVSADALFIDIPAAFILNLLLLFPSFFTGRISRIQALVALLGYFAYIGLRLALL